MNNFILHDNAQVYIENHYHATPPENKPPTWLPLALFVGLLLILVSGHVPPAAIETVIEALQALVHMFPG